MSSAASQPPHLRLVGKDDPQALDSWNQRRQAREQTIRENRQAASNQQLQPTDPRWVLAANTYAQLQGSMLTPERRARLMQKAKMIGLRPFEANLIMSVVQDHARRGERIDSAMPTLMMVDPPAPRRSNTSLHWISALLCAILVNVFLVWWLTAR